MKFISKSSNLLIVLRPGLSAQPLTGTPAKPTISVRFKDGVADVQQPELVEMMVAHPGYNSDFIAADNLPSDPYAGTRKSLEPTHVMTEMRFGTPISRTVGKSDVSQFPPEMQKLIQSAALEMAKAMLPSLVESTLKGLVNAHEEDKKASGIVAGAVTKVKGKPGRKPKVKVLETTVELQNVSAADSQNPAIQEQVS